uniref:Limbic system associated membrane protein n=1 Tax=Chinchilla lanigera TaxID=34839 RepID=A0A8C2VW69_CHILA
MSTYWLHSVWVLGFFLSLFSLQGKLLFLLKK